MILGPTIAIDPTAAQVAYFGRTAGVARYAYNWGLAEWKRQYEAGEKPTASKIKAAWNKHRKAELPWTYEVTKCSSGQAIADLGTAFGNFFRDLKKPKKLRRARYPRFKRKSLDQGFALWNDQFAIHGKRIRIPLLGWVRLREPLRFAGKIMGARIANIGGRWMVSVQVDTDTDKAQAPEGSIVGVDLGLATLATLSTGEKIEGPRPRKHLMARVKRMQRRVSLQKHRAKKASNRQLVGHERLRRLHYRIACIRKDAAHKLTTSLANRFQTVVIEDLNVSGMAKNHSLAGAILDCLFWEIRRQLEYKTAMRGGRIVVADRFFPSSKLCSACGHLMGHMPLSVREWVCPSCGTIHDRDDNASINLEQLGAACPEVTRGDMQPLSRSQDLRKAA
jgi:putative transposase